jgi:hypothetical protein
MRYDVDTHVSETYDCKHSIRELSCSDNIVYYASSDGLCSLNWAAKTEKLVSNRYVDVACLCAEDRLVSLRVGDTKATDHILVLLDITKRAQAS